MQGKNLILFIGGGQTEWPALQHALGELGIADGVLYVPGVEQALLYLENREEPIPSVVLLTIEDAGGDGLEALDILKADEQLGRVPIVVLASCNDVQLVNESFARGAAGYLVEPDDRRQFAKVIRRIQDYWSLSELP